jgi:hypothetical protein
MQAAPRRALWALVLVIFTLFSGGWSFGDGATAGRGKPSPGAAAATLQEVAPPGAVQQLNERLGEHVPDVQIQAPADQSVLPAGPWTLKLQVRDWPLADAGDLGLGPHLVVQLDDEPPLRLRSVEAAAAVTMPELRPGSHRVTVYAARPWGEAVKAPGASRQIRLHRVARNAAELPAPGTAQLIVASPDGLPQSEPVLIDWLLLDAPLQHLRNDDNSWRLRISVNGDSFLVDRQTPLWLKGFHRGSNAVQLELLDGRGDPLNPPFNSVVREVLLNDGNRPAWQRPSLSPNDLALLSGEAIAPRPVAAADSATEPAPKTEPEPETEPKPQPQPEPQPEPEPEPLGRPQPLPEAQRPDAAAPTAAEPTAVAAPNSGPEPLTENPTEPEAETQAATDPAVEPPAVSSNGSDTTTTEGQPAQQQQQPEAEGGPVATANPEASAEPSPAASQEPEAEPEELPPSSAEPPPTPAPQAVAAERLAPSSPLGGSARDQVNPDGSLLQPQRRGPLAGLREKLGG